MAKTTPSRTISLISILFLLLTTAPEPTHSLPFSFAQYRTVVSLSHSLMTRVANLRASRGDVSGSRRAQLIAEKLESGLSLGFLGLTWSLGWDYLKNYAWRDLNYAEMYGVVSDVNELLKSVGELTRANSDAERATWAGRSYQNVLGVSTSLFKKLLKVFAKSVQFLSLSLFFLVVILIWSPYNSIGTVRKLVKVVIDSVLGGCGGVGGVEGSVEGGGERGGAGRFTEGLSWIGEQWLERFASNSQRLGFLR